MTAPATDIVALRNTADSIEAVYGPGDPLAQRVRAAADAIDRLADWKRSAMEVLARWDAVAELVVTTPQDLGRSKAEIVADAIKQRDAEIERLKRGPRVGASYNDGRAKQVWMPTHVFRVRRQGDECWIECNPVGVVAAQQGPR